MKLEKILTKDKKEEPKKSIEKLFVEKLKEFSENEKKDYYKIKSRKSYGPDNKRD